MALDWGSCHLDGVLYSWLFLGSALAVVVMCGSKPFYGKILSPSFIMSFKYIKLLKKLEENILCILNIKKC